MKKYFLYILVIVLIFPVSGAHAGKEENECFKLLDKAVKQDSRFDDSRIFVKGDLSEVLYDESNNSYYDFSSYSNFRDERVVNPRRRNWWGNSKYYFQARRNNIGTIISSNNYVLSQVTWFWRDSNFDFPLEAKTGIPFWDPYKLKDWFFKEYVLYTHHLRWTWDLLSCWIVKVIPLEGRSFSEISESWYMTNILTGRKKQSILGDKKCASGFEWQYKTSGGEDYYQMKSNVCVQAYDESDYLKMEVISIAYDNESDILNEYETHPLQVKTMKDNKNHANGLKGIQDEFLNSLYNKTCFRVIHGYSLPSRCYWTSFFDTIKNSIIPQSYAKLELEWEDAQETEFEPMMVYENIPYPLYRKLESIPDENFRSYMLLSILPNFEDIIQNREDKDVLLSPFEEVFLSCGISYDQRLEIVLDFLENLDVNNFSLASLDYIDENYGNCIIPYPDKENLGTIIDGSFESNKILAERLSWQWEVWEVSEDIQAYIDERNKILAEYNAELENLESRYNSGEINSDEYNEIYEQKWVQYEEKFLLLDEKSQNQLNSEIKQQVWETNEPAVKHRDISFIVFAVVWVLFVSWVWIIVWWFTRRKKK